MRSKLRFPLLIQFNWSDNGLWSITESNGKVKHHFIFGVSVMERDNLYAVQIVLGKLAIPIAWIGFR